jgi:hypothetical protein
MSYQTAYSIRPKPMARAEAPTDDPRYRAWIRTFPCVACGAYRKIEASHTGPHGLSQKSDSRTCLPLCEACHRTGNKSLHALGPVRFEEVHVLSIAAWVAYFNRLWDARNARRAA